jgi:pimeloyl-ACP methyl ester carboxylesterase
MHAHRHILVCLHGWGGTKESFQELREALEGTQVTILTPDLPGFGSEPEPTTLWSTEDYADWVEHWICSHVPQGKIRPTVSLLGHSHGGRIALVLAARDERKRRFSIEHLYLCAAAGIRHTRHFRRIIGLTLAKTGKILCQIPGLRTLEPLAKKLLYKLVRVHDYERASPIMRQTLIRVSTKDLRPLLPIIHVSTDIFWGTEDRMTPLSDGVLMQKEIIGSTLHIYPEVRHRIHRDRAAEIGAIICARMGIA